MGYAGSPFIWSFGFRPRRKQQTMETSSAISVVCRRRYQQMPWRRIEVVAGSRDAQLPGTFERGKPCGQSIITVTIVNDKRRSTGDQCHWRGIEAGRKFPAPAAADRVH